MLKRLDSLSKCLQFPNKLNLICKLYFFFQSCLLNFRPGTHNVWVFIAQLVEHCRANAEAMG